jgi:hypothetical protein
LREAHPIWILWGGGGENNFIVLSQQSSQNYLGCYRIFKGMCLYFILLLSRAHFWLNSQTVILYWLVLLCIYIVIQYFVYLFYILRWWHNY